MMAAMTSKPPTAAPTPIPALAPRLSPAGAVLVEAGPLDDDDDPTVLVVLVAVLFRSIAWSDVNSPAFVME
jgi:hypothetical protein